MDYLRIYNKLVERGKVRITEEYTERHHIIPKCFGGSDDPSNLTNLTAREHFIAHQLLTKIHSGNHKMFYAFLCMIRDPHSYRKYNSRMYETAKRYFSKMQSIRQTENNMMWTEEAKAKISERMKGDGNPMRKYPEKNPFKGKSYVIGKKWYNNGIRNLYLDSTQQIPEGFVPGMVFKKRK